MDQSTAQSKLTTALEAHPRLAGALFAICVLVTQVGGAAANMACTNNGP